MPNGMTWHHNNFPKIQYSRMKSMMISPKRTPGACITNQKFLTPRFRQLTATESLLMSMWMGCISYQLHSVSVKGQPPRKSSFFGWACFHLLLLLLKQRSHFNCWTIISWKTWSAKRRHCITFPNSTEWHAKLSHSLSRHVLASSAVFIS